MWKYIATWILITNADRKPLKYTSSDRTDAFKTYNNLLLRAKNRTKSDDHYFDSVRIDSIKIKK